MRAILGFLLLAVCTGFGADRDYNGRWDITPVMQRPRGWWLELNGVGTPDASGTFISAYAGDLNKINEIHVSGGELTFIIIQPNNNAKFVYHARLNGSKLEGTMQREGSNAEPVKWTGVRAPVIDEADDGTWKPGKPVELFNGKDLSGWHALMPEQEMKWSVQDAVLRNAPPTTDIVSDRKFWNFTAHIEFRIREHSNSGIGLRGRYEIQILDDYGRPPNSHGAGALYSRVVPAVNASKPVGEWQTYDIRLVGRTLNVVFNGQKVLDHVHIDGLTAIANNADEGLPGPFIIQGDHSYVEIRKFTVTPLVH
ncbi:MAG TPA: DUF1080 domain-containing protein [Bryobacteraceae bacterium]|nr:DUF1080 domain-containing protein [Bryobacteraceae bacterium]